MNIRDFITILECYKDKKFENRFIVCELCDKNLFQNQKLVVDGCKCYETGIIPNVEKNQYKHEYFTKMRFKLAKVIHKVGILPFV